MNEGISKITYSELGTMVWISDPDPEDSELRRSAESVHMHAGKMLETSRTNQELRWLANTLHQALGDALGMLGD